jgi:spore germination protein GerM
MSGPGDLDPQAREEPAGGDGPPQRSRPWAWIALVVLLAAVAGGLYLWRPWERGAEVESEGPIEVGDEVGTRSITLYFGSTDGENLVDESRTIQARRHRDEEVEAVIAELVRGPQSSGAVRTMPANTRLRSAFYDEEQHLLYLDFNQALVGDEMAGSTTEILTLAAILRTIAIDFPEVTAVQFLINGLEVETLGGHIDLTRPLRPGDWL